MSLLLLFNQQVSGDPPPPPPPPPVVEEIPEPRSGGSGFLGPRYSSLTRTMMFPGMKEIIEADDEIVLRTIIQAVTKGMLH